MQTFYIDVYFLINFTVDILALYFAALFARVVSTAKRLILSSAVGSVLSCIVALNKLDGVLFIPIFIFGTLLTVELFCHGESKIRKFKLFISFIVAETFLGGFVNLIYNLLDTYVYPNISEAVFGAENRKILFLAVIILLSYGVLKLIFVMLYTSKSEKCIELTVGLNNREEKIAALVDSGCLVCDPLDLKPVIIAKKDSLEIIKNLGSIPDCSDTEIKKRMRVIPIKTVGCEKILLGIRFDYIKIKDKKEKYENIVIALDEEEGTFGGYKALVPLAIIE